MKLNNIETIKIVTRARAGAVVDECVKDAILLAATEWRDVEMIHNGNRYMVKKSLLADTVKLEGIES